jgi:protein-tyrosine phosphatase
MNYIVDSIWLGSAEAAGDIKLLRKYDISAILSIKVNDNHRKIYPKEWLRIHLKQLDGKPIPEESFEKALTFISQCQAEIRQILVHCAAGVSRSVSVVAAYLMKEKKLDPIQALSLIKEKRNMAFPAEECFTSAMYYAYPEVLWKCKNCGRFWIYGYLLPKNSTIHCTCYEPVLEHFN